MPSLRLVSCSSELNWASWVVNPVLSIGLSGSGTSAASRRASELVLSDRLLRSALGPTTRRAWHGSKRIGP